jgi:hypothetical protein
MAGKPPKRRCEIIDDGMDGASDTSEEEIYFELSGEEDTVGFRGFEKPTADYQSPVRSTSRQSGLVYKFEEYYACDLKTRLTLCENLLDTSKQGETSAGETLKYAVKTFHVAS